MLAPAVGFPRADSRAEHGVIGKGIRVRKPSGGNTTTRSGPVGLSRGWNEPNLDRNSDTAPAVIRDGSSLKCSKVNTLFFI